MKPFVIKAPLCASFVLFINLSLLLLKVQGISLEELGSRGNNPLHYDDRELGQLDEDDDEWEINQVFLASKMAYMVTKGEEYLKSRPWWNDETTRLWNDDTLSDPRFHKRVLTRTTERACYIAHMNPFSGSVDNNKVGYGPYGTDLNALGQLFADELTETEEWASRNDPSKTCLTRRMMTTLLPYNFTNELDAYVGECVASEKRIVYTGHSYGGSLATLDAVRDAEYEPWLITFGAPPILGRLCPLIKPERNVRFINTEVADLLPAFGALQAEPFLSYDITSWNFMELLAKAFLKRNQTSPTRPPPGTGTDELSLSAPDYKMECYSSLTIFGSLRIANVQFDEYPPFKPIHPSGGATLLPPFPFRSAPSLTFLNDTRFDLFNDISDGNISSDVTGELYWYNKSSGDFDQEFLFPINPMRKYYTKIRELWLQKRLSDSNGFEHGTYCQDDRQCIEGDHCVSPFGTNTTMCLFESPPVCDCDTQEYCVDGLCSAGAEGDFCLDDSDCALEICVKGRCSTGEKGQPCHADESLDCLAPRVCNLRHFELYNLCWNTDVEVKYPATDCQYIEVPAPGSGQQYRQLASGSGKTKCAGRG